MRAVVQRVSRARIVVDGGVVGEMGPGLLCLVAAREGDTDAEAEALARKLVHLRIQADDQGRMNRSVLDAGGSLGIVSQFTLYGDCSKGRRPFFGDAAAPELAEPLLEKLVSVARGEGVPVITGCFGAHMEVELTNDGPVTVIVDV